MSNINPKQRKFIDGVLAGKTLVSAYREAGYKAKSDVSAWTSASQIFRNVKVQAEFKRQMDQQKAIDELRLDRIRSEALVEIHKLVRSATNDEKVKLDAIKDVLDRAGLKPVERIEHSGQMTIESVWSKIMGETDGDSV